jgi:hypothetical protein
MYLAFKHATHQPTLLKIHFQRNVLPYSRGYRLLPQLHCRDVGGKKFCINTHHTMCDVTGGRRKTKYKIPKKLKNKYYCSGCP